MSKDVFISHATEDQTTAAEVCALLEHRGVECWIAPRDVAPGKVWDEAILDAIESTRVFLLILSTHANASPFVKNEVNRAFAQQKPIVAFRTEDVIPGRSLELYLARHHWTDGFPPPLEDKIDRLAASLEGLLGQAEGVAVGGPPQNTSNTNSRSITTSSARAAGNLVPKTAKRAADAGQDRVAHVGRALARVNWRRMAPVLIAAAAGAVLAAAAMTYFRPPARTDALPSRFSLSPPQGGNFSPGIGSAIPAMSPDGWRVAFVANRGGTQQLWVRSLDSLEAHPLAGTENANQPFWAPDSRSIGFTTTGGTKLKTVGASGGPVQSVCDSLGSSGATWNRDGVIVFGSQVGGLFRVAAMGGQPVRLTTPDASRREIAHRFPSFLPDGRHFLYLAFPSNAIWIGSLDRTDTKRLMNADSQAEYASRGYLLFARQSVLMAQPFDVNRLALSGDAVAIAEPLIADTDGRRAFSASDVGTLTYRTGVSSPPTQLMWADRRGRSLGEIGQPGLYRNPALSPDGHRVAVEAQDPQNRTQQVWLIEVGRGVASRFTFDAGNDIYPVWSPDGTRIAFGSDRQPGEFNLYTKASNGTAAEELLLKSGADTLAAPYSWSPDGQFIVYRTFAPVVNMMVLPLGGDRKPALYQQNNSTQVQGQVSPNGRWIAYDSVESGRFEVYVQSFPTPGAKWQVSKEGGYYPRWRGDGNELFYSGADGQLWAVPIADTGALDIGTSMPLFRPRLLNGATAAAGFRAQYDVTHDGQKFLLNVPLEDASAPPITVVLNWTAGLKE
jgi:eukaryotic-like serine/threonine-protein kinase